MRPKPLMITATLVLLCAALLGRAALASPPARAHPAPHAKATIGQVTGWTCLGWTVMAPPMLPVIGGLGAISPNDIWAVGGNLVAPYADHWNGTTWSNATMPAPPGSPVQLDGAAAVASQDVWAVGFFANQSARQQQTLIEHWDGMQWSIVPSPNPGTLVSELHSVSAPSADDVWAVGSQDDGTLIEHWDGTQWSVVPSPNGSEPTSILYGVTAISPDDAWAVGQTYGGYENSVTYPLIEHWDGSQWSVVSNPAPVGQQETTLYGVASASAYDTSGPWACTRAPITTHTRWSSTGTARAGRWYRTRAPLAARLLPWRSCRIRMRRGPLEVALVAQR